MGGDEMTTSPGEMPDPGRPDADAQPFVPTPPPSPYAPKQSPQPYPTAAPQISAPSPYAGPGGSASPYAGAANPYASPYASNQQPSPYPAKGPSSSGKALGVLICGICSILFAGLVLPGIVLGIVALVLASQAAREGDRDGKVTGGRVCAAIGLVGSAFMLVMYLFFGYFFMVSIGSYEGSSSYAESSMSAPPASEAETAKAELVARATLDGFADPDDALIVLVAERADERFLDATDFHLVDVGMDEREFAVWLLGDVEYDIGEYDAFAYEDGTAIVFATTKSRTIHEIVDELQREAQKDGKISGAEARRKAYAAHLQSAMENAPRRESFISLDLVKAGDTWVVDEGSLEDALEQMFSL